MNPCGIFLLAGASLAMTGSAIAADHSGKTVAELQANHVAADCFYFRLDGVAEADPVKPNNPWFAIDRGSYGSKDVYALLLAARLTGAPVHVITTGAVACNYAAAGYVFL